LDDDRLVIGVLSPQLATSFFGGVLVGITQLAAERVSQSSESRPSTRATPMSTGLCRAIGGGQAGATSLE